MATRQVTDTGLRLAPELLGVELASPIRRLAAFAVDVAILAIPSLLVALLVAWAVLAVRAPAALDALVDLMASRASSPEAQRQAMQDLVPLLVEYDMPGTPPETIVAYREGDLDRAVTALADLDVDVVLNVQDGAGPTSPAGHVRLEVGRLMPTALRLASFYGLGALYFSGFASRRSGATPGKRWLGVRVVRVDGGRLGLLASFDRFFGYAQVPASFFTALVDFWRDPNRRLPHDRLAGTLVIRT